MAKYTDEDTTLEGRETGESVSERSESEVEGLSTETETTAGERAADDTGDDPDPVKAVAGLKKRLAKLTAQRNEARAAAQERDALRARIAAYEQRERDAEEARRERQRNTPAGRKAEEDRAAVRRAIDAGYGDGASEEFDEFRAERQLRKEQYALQGVSYLKSELSDHDLPTDEQTLVRWERAVGSEIAEDPELHAAFRRPATQQAAIQEAFQRARDGLVNPALKNQGAKPLARIERNRQAVLGSNRGGPVQDAPEPEYNPQPPKDLKGRDLEAWWADQRDKLWDQLSKREAAQ